MKITIITESFDQTRSGSHVSLDVLARWLTRRGHDVRILSLNVYSSNDLREEVPFTVVSVKDSLPSFGNWRGWIQKFRRLENDADLFHLFDPFFAPFLGLYRYHGGKTPVVLRLNSYSMFCTNSGKMNGDCHKNCTVLDRIHHDRVPIERRAAKLPQYVSSRYTLPEAINDIDELFAQSPAIKRIYAETGIDPERITVISNFFDPEFGREETISDRNSDNDDNMRILYTGRLKHIKGVDVLLEAVGKSQLDVTVDIVGDGEMRSELEKQARALSIADRVEFHGWVDHDSIPAYCRRSDLFVQPGRWAEPSGRGLLEAMQFGCVPIVSNVGGPPWIVDDAGLVFEPENADHLAHQLRQVSDPRAYAELERDLQHRLEDFEPDSVISEIESRYRAVVEQ